MTYQHIIKETCKRHFSKTPYACDELINTAIYQRRDLKQRIMAQAIAARKAYFPHDERFDPHDLINDYEYLRDVYQRMSYHLEKMKA